MMGTSSEYWTEKRVLILKELWAAGHSSKSIAAKLGDLAHCKDGGRNAVIGKVHRLNLSGHAKGRPRTSSDNRPVKIKLKAKPPRVRVRGLNKPRKIVGFEEPTSLGVKLLDLTAQNCRWPIGEPKDDDFGFCGAPKLDGENKSYCGYHHQVSRMPVRKRIVGKPVRHISAPWSI
jgi:GcrA cell cycle regulator